jgi:hypothetical protein
MATTGHMITEEMHDIRNGDGLPRHPVNMGGNAPESEEGVVIDSDKEPARP